MIIFDRFLCCISIKTFGKFFGWIGMMASLVLGYAIFLIASAKRSNLYAVKDRFFPGKIKDDGLITCLPVTCIVY